MLIASGVTVRFGKRTLFEDVNIKFNKGCCYGIIGANGAGKSTFLKVLSGELEPSKGEVTKEKTERISVLKQNHFAYEDETVMDTVIMGNQELYNIMKEKNEIYAKPDFSEEDGMKAAKLEEKFAELDGWNAESDAAILLNDDFYNFMLQGRAVVDGISVLRAEYLIPFKMFAWLDLKNKKQNGEHVDSRDIKKHKYDVFRLLQIVDSNTIIPTDGLVKKSINEFFEEILKETLPLSQLGLLFNQEEAMGILHDLYGI